MEKAPRHLRRLRRRGRLLHGHITLQLGPRAGAAQPLPEAKIHECEMFLLGTLVVDDCLVTYEMTRYLPGEMSDGAGYAIWDVDRGGDPIEVFEDTDAGWDAARARVGELIRADPATPLLLEWIRGERSDPPWRGRRAI